MIDLKHHLNRDSDKPCRYLLVSCPLQCGDLCELKDIDEHVARECTRREVHCEYCGVMSRLHLMDDHYTVCEMYPTPCPQDCGQMVNRKYLQEHQSSECVNCTTTCLFRDVGCKALVTRENYQAHIQECKEKHLVTAHEKVCSDMHALKEEVSKIREENQFVHSKVASLHAGLQICHENASVLRQENIQLKSALLNEMSYLHAMANPCEVLAVNCIKTHLRGQVIHLIPGGECMTFRITDYLARKKAYEVCYSPPFYIAQGYKFCLAVHLNGAGAGEGTHVAVVLHLSAGQFDSDLTWPVLLEEDFEIRLMRQESPKETKKSFLKGSMWGIPRSPPPYVRSLAADESRGRSRSNATPDASPTLPMNARLNEEYKNVSECQVLSISQLVNQPRENEPLLVSALELFCLQGTFDATVFLDSIVIQCKLIANQGSNIHPVHSADIGWKD